jgi:hypothetical protein
LWRSTNPATRPGVASGVTGAPKAGPAPRSHDRPRAVMQVVASRTNADGVVSSAHLVEEACTYRRVASDTPALRGSTTTDPSAFARRTRDRKCAGGQLLRVRGGTPVGLSRWRAGSRRTVGLRCRAQGRWAGFRGNVGQHTARARGADGRHCAPWPLDSVARLGVRGNGDPSASCRCDFSIAPVSPTPEVCPLCQRPASCSPSRNQ